MAANPKMDMIVAAATPPLEMRVGLEVAAALGATTMGAEDCTPDTETLAKAAPPKVFSEVAREPAVRKNVVMGRERISTVREGYLEACLVG